MKRVLQISALSAAGHPENHTMTNRTTVWGGSLLLILCVLYVGVAAENDQQPPTGDTPAASDSGPKDAQLPTDEPPETTESATSSGEGEFQAWPLVCLGVGIVVVLGLIIGFRVNAFIALILAAITVSLMAPGPWAVKISRVATAFGNSAGGIAIVIAMAAVIGKCMLDSGAADRVVRAFLNLLGEKRAPAALMGSGFVLAVPVFFDTVFYLLVPLARSLHTKTGKQYLKYLLAIGAGGAITHTLVPPTPGPLLMAQNLRVDVGMMIMVGAIVAVPAAILGLLFAGIADRLMPVPMRQIGTEPEPKPLDDAQLPSLFMSLLPVILPVVMISTNTIFQTLADADRPGQLRPADVKDWSAFRAEVGGGASLDGEANTPSERIWQKLNQREVKRKERLERKGEAGTFTDVRTLFTSDSSLSDDEKQAVVDALNEVLGQRDLYSYETFVGVRLPKNVRDLQSGLGERSAKVDIERANRRLLEAVYNTPEQTLIEPMVWDTRLRRVANITSLFGNANLALLLSAIIAMFVLVRQRNLKRHELAAAVETALMSGGVIILITAGGGAFGSMLKEAQVGPALRSMFGTGGEGQAAGIMFLLLGFLIAVVLKIAQGSSTVAMITGSAMLVGVADATLLGFNPVYLATAVGGGSLVGSWMNDSGFWIFAKMGGLTEEETLKSWTIMLSLLGLMSLGVTMLLANFMPLL